MKERINWSKTMTRTYEYYEVDPVSWSEKRAITSITNCTIDKDLSSETIMSATIDTTEVLNECYIRIYMIVIQNGVTTKIPLGTFIVQTPSVSFDGRVRTVSLDAYSPLIELKETQPPIGYSVTKGSNIVSKTYLLIRDHMRGPVVSANNEVNTQNDFVANTDDTWLSFSRDLLRVINMDIRLDELSRVIFMPRQDPTTLQPIWTYTDDNASILYPDISVTHDLFGIPNVIEVVYSDENTKWFSRVVNDDPNSPLSTINRGREIVYRETSPNLMGNVTQGQVDRYAKNLLISVSSVERTVTYSHGYCPVNIGDCVRLNYASAGIVNVKALVVSQSISCDSVCKVSETATFTTRLWEG